MQELGDKQRAIGFVSADYTRAAAAAFGRMRDCELRPDYKSIVEQMRRYAALCNLPVPSPILAPVAVDSSNPAEGFLSALRAADITPLPVDYGFCTASDPFRVLRQTIAQPSASGGIPTVRPSDDARDAPRGAQSTSNYLNYLIGASIASADISTVFVLTGAFDVALALLDLSENQKRAIVLCAWDTGIDGRWISRGVARKNELASTGIRMMMLDPERSFERVQRQERSGFVPRASF